MCNRQKVLSALAVFLVLMISVPAMAWAPRVSYDAAGTVQINARVAVRFQTSNGNLTPTQRAEITAGRIQQLMVKGADARAIVAKGDKFSGKIYLGENLICVATALDAKENAATPLSLARSWASNIKALLLMPPIKLSDRNVVVPLGENRAIDVMGAAYGAVGVRVSDDKIAGVEADSTARTVKVIGRQVGSTSVNVMVEGESQSFAVYVKKYAGRMPDNLVAEVTGSPCPAAFVEYVASRAVMQNAIAEPDSKISIDKIENVSDSLASGASRQVKATVTISGSGYIPISLRTSVEVRNIAMAADSVNQLFYSNNPERLLKYQTLFAGRMDRDMCTRLLYHHQNMMRRGVHLIIEIINSSPTPARFRVFRGVSKPMVDTVLVGHTAALRFLRDVLDNASVLETVPPGSRLVLISDKMDSGKTSSGIFQISQLEGDDTYLRVTAAQPGVDNVHVGTVAQAPDALMLRLSDEVYPSPSKIVEAEYKVGERWAFIPIGKHALDDSAAQRKLYGNYGVTYDINVHVENPTGDTRKIEVLFDPTAGIASGVFVIDGHFIQARNALPPNEVPLTSYKLGPGASRDIHIVTVPLAGSNYPAMLVVKS